MDFSKIIKSQRKFFSSGKTLDITFRVNMMKKLAAEIKTRKKDIMEALYKDLGKSSLEAYTSEIAVVLESADYIIKNTPRWSAIKKVKTPILQFGAKSFIVSQPYGNTLIISPWNYPFLLSLDPLFSALCAGNTAILKPSEYSLNTTKVIVEIISKVFPPCYVFVATGGIDASRQILKEKFDYIFFTGSTRVGKIVAQKASENLTPITLELGGKSPCIVDSSANIKASAKRIIFGKLMNCGQTCVAPDYILVEEAIFPQLVMVLKKEINSLLGNQPLDCKKYGKIINKSHFNRLVNLISSCKDIIGGEYDESSLKIAPALILNPNPQAPVMQEEIFGPLLPIIPYKTADEAITFVKNRPKPLALYIFSENKNKQKNFCDSLSFGGGCINDTIFHLTTPYLPFGGVGESGMGCYHGKKSFETFSHSKSILSKSTKVSLPLGKILYRSNFFF